MAKDVVNGRDAHAGGDDIGDDSSGTSISTSVGGSVNKNDDVVGKEKGVEEEEIVVENDKGEEKGRTKITHRK